MGQSLQKIGADGGLKAWLVALGSTFLFNNLVFLVALMKKDNSIVDISWSLSIWIPNLVTMFMMTQSYQNPRALLSNILVTVWALRLHIHLLKRYKGKEDYRYAQWREDWQKEGKNVAFTSWYFVFMLQGMFACINNLSALYISMYGTKVGGSINALDIVGLLVWLVGFYFEAMGDYQLTQFKKDPDNQGKLMKDGVWKYTRHPNYFGEAAMWWGIYALACNLGLGGQLTIFSALVMTFLLRFVSGVEMLERKQKQKPEFQVYMRETNAFFPLPKKTISEEEKQSILAQNQLS